MLGSAMRLMRLTAEFAALAIACIAVSLLHHGHIVMFLTDVRARLRGAKELEGGRVLQEPSKLEVHFGNPDVHYIVAVHRKMRSLEVGLHFEGERDENERHLQVLADRARTLRSRLGPNIEMEHWGRSWTRVHDSTVLSRGDWSPKRDLTPALVERTARKLLRFVRVLQPMVEKRAVSRSKR
jgi:hypothetical protein